MSEHAQKFRRKNSEVEAMQWAGTVESAKRIAAWSGCSVSDDYGRNGNLVVETPAGEDETMRKGDWLIKRGEAFFFAHDDHFYEAYEPATTQGAQGDER